MSLYPTLAARVQELEEEFKLIPEARKALLEKLAAYLQEKANGRARLNFICTHNSRRSHISQLWAAVAAHQYGHQNLETYSGGTEATAFNPRAVAALERIGFQIHKPGGDNPKYRVSYSPEEEPLVCFSKTFDDPVNPTSGFAAIMTCSEADANCPFIPGAEFRLPLTYEDPKEADGTPQEARVYDERVRQIGREILHAFAKVHAPS